MTTPRITLEFVLFIVAIIAVVVIIFFNSQIVIYIKDSFCPMMNRLIDNFSVWLGPVKAISLPHVCGG